MKALTLMSALTVSSALTLSSVHQAIDKATRSDTFLQNELRQKGWTMNRVKDPSSDSIFKDKHPSYSDLKTPWHFCIALGDAENNDKVCGVATFYVAYSTWNGRILYVDQMVCDNDIDDATEQLLLRTLAEVATDLGFARLTWRHKETPFWHSEGSNLPEMHKEVLTLSMDIPAMEKYVSESNLGSAKPTTGAFTQSLAETAINDILAAGNAASQQGFRLRLATEKDLDTIGRLVQGLADYVKESESVHLGVDDYRPDGFSSDQDPLFYCLLMDTIDSETGEAYTCGYAFVFFGYVLGEGRFLYLEDLFLEVDYRQRGGGNLIMQTLAKICQSLQCSKLYWQALDWNTSGLKFYNKIGAKTEEGVLTSRYCEDAMKQFAEKGTA